MQIACMAAERSTCLSDKKGAVIVKDNRVIATGYSGAPAGVRDCAFDRNMCYKRQLGYGHGEGHHVCLAVHAEANAILQAASIGIPCKGTTMYCTHEPCGDCAKLIINSGIKKVYFKSYYPSELTNDLFGQAGIECKLLISEK